MSGLGKSGGALFYLRRGELAQNYGRPLNTPEVLRNSPYQPKVSVFLDTAGSSYVKAGHVPLYSCSWTDFNINARKHVRRLDVLRLMLKSLWASGRYNQVYCEFLQGLISKEEFKQASEAFALESRELTDDTVEEEIQIAYEEIGEQLSSDELADLLHLDWGQAERAACRLHESINAIEKCPSIPSKLQLQ